MMCRDCSQSNWIGLFAILAAAVGPKTYGQVPAEPVVARIQMQFHLDGNVIDVIEKGDLLTVLKDQGDAYHVVTFDGHQGLVDKVNALLLAEAVEVYSELIAEHPQEGRYFTLRASAWWARKDAERALADFDQAIQRSSWRLMHRRISSRKCFSGTARKSLIQRSHPPIPNRSVSAIVTPAT